MNNITQLKACALAGLLLLLTALPLSPMASREAYAGKSGGYSSPTRQSAPIRQSYSQPAQMRTPPPPVRYTPRQNSVPVGNLKTARATLLSGTSLKSGMLHPPVATVIPKSSFKMSPQAQSSLAKLSGNSAALAAASSKQLLSKIDPISSPKSVQQAERKATVQQRVVALRNKLAQGKTAKQKQQSVEIAKKNILPANPSQLGHIFRNAEGHLLDSPENRKLLLDVANDEKSVVGTDQFGNTWSAKSLSDGTQVWTQMRNGQIINGGLNLKPRTYNSKSGLSSPTKPEQ